jgi:hypothetical protein
VPQIHARWTGKLHVGATSKQSWVQTRNGNGTWELQVSSANGTHLNLPAFNRVHNGFTSTLVHLLGSRKVKKSDRQKCLIQWLLGHFLLVCWIRKSSVCRNNSCESLIRNLVALQKSFSTQICSAWEEEPCSPQRVAWAIVYHPCT